MPIQTIVSEKTGKNSYRVFITRPGLKRITKTFKKKKDAVEFSRTVEGSDQLQQALGDPVAKSLKLNELAREFLADYTGTGDTCLFGFWIKHYGDLPVSKITQQSIRKHLNSLKVSGSTINRYKSALSSMFEYGKSS